MSAVRDARAAIRAHAADIREDDTKSKTVVDGAGVSRQHTPTISWTKATDLAERYATQAPTAGTSRQFLRRAARKAAKAAR